MEIHVRDERKLVEVWLTGAEQEDGTLQERLRPLYRGYSGKDYQVAVFCSGTRDLFQQTSDLLCYNKKRVAQLEEQKARQDAPCGPAPF